MGKRPDAERRPSGFVVLLAFALAIGAAVALAVAAVLLRDDDGTPAPRPTPVVELAGIPQDGAVLGSTEANVTLIEYADLQCPACRSYNEALFPQIVTDYVRPGRVKTEFRGVTFIGEDSETALRYVLAAGLQDRLWNLAEALFRYQGDENSGWVEEELVRELAAEIPGLDVQRLLADAQGADVAALLVAAEEDAADKPGTPLFYIRVGDEEPYGLEPGIGEADLVAALDAALAE